MAEAKLEIKVGAVAFSGEGGGKWLSDQLDKILAKMPELAAIGGPPEEGRGEGANGASRGEKGANRTTLAGFLKEKGATTSQVRKFLATAVWLHDNTRKNRLTTKDVSKALADASQKRLNNAADCLNKNVGKGYCEKDGKEFFVTDDGRAEVR